MVGNDAFASALVEFAPEMASCDRFANRTP